MEPVEDCLKAEEQKGEYLIQVFTQLSKNREDAANAEDAINEKSCEMLSEFVAHVEQSTMCSQLNRDQRCDLGLNFVYRVCACIYLIFFVYVSICI